MFPTIKHVDELRAEIVGKEEIRESSLGDDLTCFAYMIAGDDTFSSNWTRECRGIVFDRHGRVCSRPLHKFFNVGERESTRVENIDWSKVVRVMEKRDGSMIHTVIDWQQSYPGLNPIFNVRVKSKKSFESPVALSASSWLNRHENIQELMQYTASINCTAIFEWTAPDARIVLFYPDPELCLLHVRENDTGRYWTLQELRQLASEYNVKLVDEVKEFWAIASGSDLGPTTKVEFQPKWLLKAAAERTNFEGWVIQFENGEMVKLKTDWYLKLHRSMTFLRERDIAELVLEEKLDDLKSTLRGEGVSLSEIIDVENRVLYDIRQLEHHAKSLASEADYSLPRKDFVLKYKHVAGEYFDLLMRLYSKTQPDYVKFFTKYKLKQDYSLRQLNLCQSIAETD